MRVLSTITTMLLLASCCHNNAVVQALTPNGSGRRAFVQTAFSSASAAAAAAVVTASSPFPSFADDDLAMPTEAEQKKLDDDAMAERLRRKAELQKKAAAPKNFSESFKSEQSKQKDMKAQTKEERRDAMCQELGRGC